MSRKLLRAVAVGAVASVMAACGGGSGSSPSGGNADKYPRRTVEVLVGYAPGGAADTGARAVAKGLEKQLGGKFAVVNRPGATGGVAMQALANAKPDGYTIASVSTSAAVTNGLTQKVKYTPDDYTLIGAFASYPWVYAVNANSPYKTSAEFFAAAKASPGKIKLGTPGASAQSAIQMRRLKSEYGVEVTVVPFDGSARLIPELLGNNLDAIGMVSSADVMSQIRAGKMRAVAVGGEKRVPYLPDTPTLKELGFPELTIATAYTGIGVPAGTPDAIVKKLSDAIAKLPQDAEFVKTVGEDYVAGDISGPELTEAYARQRETYKDVLGKG